LSTDSLASLGSTAETQDGEPSVSGASERRRDPPAGLPAGTKVGRYEIERVLGIGGMGIVYAARDPGLDRSIALKVLRPRPGRDGSAGQRRLVREAQALAKLSHENVVIVFDVGMHDGSVFVAMEHLRGTTLTSWLRAKPSVPEILHAFTQAGRGLAAAHDAGLVHRDFKPDNVFVCDDARVCVTDFGLARRTTDDSFERGTTETMPAIAEPMQTDGVAGTPAYMAPEQHSGLATQAQADQFAFCVALYEALFRQRPFAGETVTRLAVEVIEGRVRTPPRVAGVSRTMTNAILRGLRSDPHERWPSMTMLLDALRPPRRRGLWIAGGGLVLAASTLAIARMPEPQRCDTADDAVERVWTPARRAEIREAFASSGRAGGDTFAAIEGTLDAHADLLRTATTTACREHRDLPGFDAERACLEGRVAAFDGLLGALAQIDANGIDRAPHIVADLPDPRACADADELALELAPPTASAIAIADVRARLDVARAHYDLGRWDEAIALGRTLLGEAEAIAWEPLVAEVAVELAQSMSTGSEHAEAERLMAQAYWTAASSKHDRIAARAATNMMYMVGVRAGRHDDAIVWEEQAAAAVARLGEGTSEEATFHSDRSVLEQARGKLDDAYVLAEKALEIRARIKGAEHVSVGAVRQNMGAIRLKQGRLDDARALLEDARRIMAATLGESHPSIARIDMNLGAVAIKSGDLPRAAAHLERGIAIFESRDSPTDLYQGYVNLSLVQRKQGDLDAAKASLDRALVAVERAHGKKHSGYASVLTSLANLATTRGRHEEALALNREALEVREAALGPDHEEIAYPLGGIANALVVLGRNEEALPVYRRQLEIVVKNLGEQHARTALVHLNLGKLLRDLDQRDEADAEVERAVAIYRAVLPADHPETAAALVELSRARLDATRVAEAIDLATQAEAMLQRTPGEPPALGLARFALARALWVRGEAGDRARADALVRAAKDEMAKTANAKTYLGLVDAWRSSRG
jgi:tetratricopeptide (TPR) repeat protein